MFAKNLPYEEELNMAEQSLLDPRNDFICKRIFGSMDNKDVLLAFLNRIFADARLPQLVDIQLDNPYSERDAVLEKQVIFDIKGRTTDRQHINIEMQVCNKYNTIPRTLYYWSKMFSNSLKQAESYRHLRRCVAIHIADYIFLKEAEYQHHYHHVFRVREDRMQGVLSDHLEIHFVELPKLAQLNVNIAEEAGLVNWLLFLNRIDQTYWEALSMNEPELQKAMTMLEILSQDTEARRLYEMREKYLKDEASMVEGARVEGKREIARNMVAKGMDSRMIAELTQLSEEEIKEFIQ